MAGMRLLLFAACMVLVRCQQKPQVLMSPMLNEVFLGELFYLSCNDGMSGKNVKWYLDDVEQNGMSKTWKIAGAARQHSGFYHCESNGQKSDRFNISVLDYLPKASLMIEARQPVVRRGDSPILQLINDDGLQGWSCLVFNGIETKPVLLAIENNESSIVFHPDGVTKPENIFWCFDKNQQGRSNQIIVRMTVEYVLLQMYPQPAVDGTNMILHCHVWGTNQIDHIVFYKENMILQDSDSPNLTISKVAEANVGSYKCKATFRYKNGPPRASSSDPQDLLVKERPVFAVLSPTYNGLSCSCPRCPKAKDVFYRWYHKSNNSHPLVWNNRDFKPQERGTYVCQAVWNNGRSSLSNSHDHPQSTSVGILVAVLLIVLGLVAVLVAVAIYRWSKRRGTMGPVYEDVALRVKEVDGYESLQRPPGAQREAEYDTLHPGTQRKEREYEPLKKEEMKDAVYHTVGPEGAAGGTGGYEALKKEGMKDAVYHTLKVEGVEGGEG